MPLNRRMACHHHRHSRKQRAAVSTVCVFVEHRQLPKLCESMCGAHAAHSTTSRGGLPAKSVAGGNKIIKSKQIINVVAARPSAPKVEQNTGDQGRGAPISLKNRESTRVNAPMHAARYVYTPQQWKQSQDVGMTRTVRENTTKSHDLRRYLKSMYCSRNVNAPRFP